MTAGRSTVYNSITSEEKTNLINKNNSELATDFLDYLSSIDRSPMTIKAYKSDLEIFFTYVLDNLDNKDFQNITKREFARFQSHCINVWKWSPKRIRRVKSAISSLSNYIENILSDECEEFADFKKSINKIESPANVAVREKTVLKDEEVQLLLDTLLERKEYQKCCIVAVLAYSGMRKSELLQMKPEYFDENHLVFGALHQTDYVRSKGRGVNGKRIQKWIMTKGDKYIFPWIEQRKELGIDCEMLFVTKDNGKYVPMKSIDHYMDELSEIVQKPVYAHLFRHFTCTMLLGDANLPSEVVREFFQWESVEMTKVYYDNKASDDFGKYFTPDGIVQQEQKGFSDIK